MNWKEIEVKVGNFTPLNFWTVWNETKMEMKTNLFIVFNSFEWNENGVKMEHFWDKSYSV